MVPDPYRLEILIAERRRDLLRAAEEARLARLAAAGRGAAPGRGSLRIWVADALRSLADRLEPTTARPCEEQRGLA